jgi:hypothetical protein
MMRRFFGLALFLSVAMAIVGCGGDLAPAGDDDMAMSGGGGDGGGMSKDMTGGAADMTMKTGSDGGGSGSGKALCAACTTDTECASGLCAPYMMGNVKKCSHSCAAATASTDCPGINACNGMNVCKCM